jgi:hypothetical protein
MMPVRFVFFYLAIFSDHNGEYGRMHAFCIDETKPLFCIPELFKSASINQLHEKLVSLYNTEPYNGRIMTDVMWSIYKE